MKCVNHKLGCRYFIDLTSLYQQKKFQFHQIKKNLADREYAFLYTDSKGKQNCSNAGHSVWLIQSYLFPNVSQW